MFSVPSGVTQGGIGSPFSRFPSRRSQSLSKVITTAFCVFDDFYLVIDQYYTLFSCCYRYGILF